MREILFKAKTKLIVGTYNMGKEDGEWVKGYLRCDCGKWLIYQFETDYADQIAYEVDPDTICQYTGLTDKNGNKIWENDIVDIKHYAENAHEVKWGYGGFYVGINGLLCHYNTVCEVIGNIFDNADLLKGEQYGEIDKLRYVF